MLQDLSYYVNQNSVGETNDTTSDVLLDKMRPLQKKPFGIYRYPFTKACSQLEVNRDIILEAKRTYYYRLAVEQEGLPVHGASQQIIYLVVPSNAYQTTFRMLEEYESVEQLATKYAKVWQAFEELKRDFDEVPRRIVRCMCLEEELATLETSLDSEDAECLAWCVSLIKDALSYNYAEDFNISHMELFKDALKMIVSKELSCTEEDYQNLHNKFLKANLALLPNSRKALEEYQ